MKGISLGLKAVNLVDQLAGKKAKDQVTAGETALGYDMDENINAGTKYGGLFGNKARKQANKYTSASDISNINKKLISNQATKANLAGANMTSNIANKNYLQQQGFTTNKLRT
jgi:nickel-dependent lactate racemase